MSVVLQRCNSYCNPDYCKIKTVCRPLNRTSKFVSLDIYIHAGITLKAPIYVSDDTIVSNCKTFNVLRVPYEEMVAFKKFTTVYRPHMLHLKVELCSQLLIRTHPFFKLKNERVEAGNLVEPCPFSGHRYMKAGITNLGEFDYPILPLIPAGEWRVDITLSKKINGSEVVLASGSQYYEVKALTAEQF